MIALEMAAISKRYGAVQALDRVSFSVAAGEIFGYLGPDPAPLLPRYDVLLMEDGVKSINVQTVHANWFQHIENIVDISHLAWLHGYTFPAYGAKKVVYHWDRTHYGANNVMDMINEGVKICSANAAAAEVGRKSTNRQLPY